MPKPDQSQACHQWSIPAKRLLLNLFPKYTYLKSYSNRRIISKGKMFFQIAEMMRLIGYEFNATQVKNRWQGFEKSYENNLKNSKATGRSIKDYNFKKNWIFFY